MSRPRVHAREQIPTIRKRDDGMWHAYVTMGRLASGKTKRQHVKRRTKAEAAREVTRLMEARKEDLTTLQPHLRTLTDWIEEWLTVRLPNRSRSPKTIYNYRSCLTRHVIPRLGDRLLVDLTSDDLDACYAELTKAGVPLQALNSVHRALRSCLGDAVTKKLLVSNPAGSVSLPRPDETEIDPLTRDEVNRILTQARLQRNGARWGVALMLGLRQGEALGLQWGDVDFETGLVVVRRGLRREAGEHGCLKDGVVTCDFKQGAKCPDRLAGGGLVTRATKTRRSRVVQMPSPLLADLRRHREVQDAERLAADDLWVEGDWVFATPFGDPIDPRRDWGEWKTLLETVEVRERRVHDARHTLATFMLDAGIPVLQIMAHFGWTSPRMVDRYTHPGQATAAQVAARMEGVF